jgi:hypothetical protein
VWVAACSPVPDPSLGCSSDAQCPGGACVAGVCVVTGDADIGQPDAALDANADTVLPGDIPCSVDQTCIVAFPQLSSCAIARCEDGFCALVPLPAEVTCSTGGICPAPGNCALGACVAFGAPCDDQNACTADQCGSDGCKHVAFATGIGCPDDGLPCTDDQCQNGICAHPLREGRCLVDGQCALDGAVPEGIPCRICDASAPTSWQLVTSGGCDDGDDCTGAGVCDAEGDCLAAPIDCNDDNACTADQCDAEGGCVNLPIDATCTDADPCTLGGICTVGVCVPLDKLDCDDQNPCTADTCSPGLGCVHAPQAGPCLADADPCTDDVCLGGACVAVPSVSVCDIGGVCVPAGGVSDANPCLTCAPNISKDTWTVLANVACDDGDACTALDACIDGSCKGAQLTCKDASPCTLDSCDNKKGCVFTPVDSDCEDGSACTVGDTCVKGACKGTPVSSADCLDGNPCTADSCDDVVGCTHTPTNNACDDGDPCTKGDFCTAGLCVAGQIVCPCEFNSDCDDSNPCTIDICELGKGCANKPMLDLVPCDDADACTGADACKDGICKGIKLECDDGNPCTKASCASAVGCVGKPLQGVVCDDGSACTKGDVCLDGVCLGSPKVCDDGNDCTLDTCSPATGLCKHNTAPDGSNCMPDAVPCTLDLCVGGACKHDLVAPGFCLISGACISGGASHPAKVCQGCVPQQNPLGWSLLLGSACDDGNACTGKTTCSATGACLGAAIDCNDDNPCTLDACDPGKIGQDPCSYVVTKGPCEDGDACTVGENCVGGVCLGAPVECDDENPCTTDECSPSSGCFALDKDGVDCDDGDLCTGGDVCAGGKCVGDQGKACDDGNPCTIDSCNDGKACSHQPGGDACDDGDPCTTGDSCVSGNCVPGGPVVCAQPADSGTCEVSVCIPSQGGCTVVSACPTLHACVSGICQTSTNGTTGAAVEVPLGGATQPLRPSLIWQETSTGIFGALPQLWVAAQRNGCDAALGVSAQLSVARFAPQLAAPVVTTLKTPSPTGAGAWCALQPVLQAHPNSYDAVVLGWIEGGADGSACSLGTAGGSLRLGLLGNQGDGLEFGVAAACPTGKSALLPWRPAFALAGKGSSGGAPKLSEVTGSLLRASSGGSQLFGGDPVGGWGGGKGVALPSATLGGYTETPSSARPAVVPWTTGAVLLQPTRFVQGSKAVAALTALRVDAAGVAAKTRSVVLTGASVGGTITYVAVEAALDPAHSRLGVVLGGLAVDAGKPRHFLAFARVHPDQAPTAGPKLVSVIDGVAGSKLRFDTFRIASMPNDPEFLLVYAVPGAGTLKALRIEPVDDASFNVVALGDVGGQFVSHLVDDAADSSGGLSELIVSPDATRYSIAWEGAGKLWLRTAKLPTPN